MSTLDSILTFCRLFNAWAGMVLAIACAFRLLRIHLYWRRLYKNGLLYEGLNIEKLVCWVTLFVFCIGAGFSSFAHKSSNSMVGIFIPVTTLALIMTGCAIAVARQKPGMRQKVKNKEAK